MVGSATSWGTMEIISTIEGVKFWYMKALNCGSGRELVGKNLPEWEDLKKVVGKMVLLF
jgi:hypothetical protein